MSSPLKFKPRHAEVLTHAAAGRGNAGAAEKMNVTPATAKSYRRDAVAVLGAKTLPHAVAIAIRRGLITPP